MSAAPATPPAFVDDRPLGTRPWLAWVLTFVGATLLVLAVAGQSYIFDATMRDQGGPPLLRRMRWPLIWWYIWAMLAPLIYVLARRFPFTQATWRKSVFVHIGGCTLFFCLHVFGQVTAMLLPAYQDVHDTLIEAVKYHILTSLYLNLLVYGIIVAVAHTVLFYQRYRRRELGAVQLESELARARLQALKTQLHPHFLFNTLHSISTLMYRDVEAADRMLARLSELLRLTLESSDAQEVSLHDEISMLEKYLEIEKIRLGERLTVDFDIDPALDDVLVPNLVLQPIVENAVKHGIAPRSAPGRIEVRAWAEDGRLHLRVSDDGLGLPEPPSRLATGIGLSNVRARLNHLYGEAVSMRASHPTGLIVDLTLPLRYLYRHTVASDLM